MLRSSTERSQDKEWQFDRTSRCESQNCEYATNRFLKQAILMNNHYTALRDRETERERERERKRTKGRERESDYRA
jgi:hypothetical protein